MTPRLSGTLRNVTAILRCTSAAGVVSWALCACYNQIPLTSLPEPGAYVVVQLNDAGRIGMAAQMGPAVMRVEGFLDSRSDSQFVLRVMKVTTITGAPARWTGEPVRLRAAFAQVMSERRLSRGRTAAFTSGLVAAVGFFVVTRGLSVLGGGNDDTRPVDPGGGTPGTRWTHP